MPNGKRRILVQSDAANRASRTTTVALLTDPARRIDSAVAQIFPAASGGLRKSSAALCNRLRTVDRLRLIKRLGMLVPSDMLSVEHGLREMLDLEATR